MAENSLDALLSAASEELLKSQESKHGSLTEINLFEKATVADNGKKGSLIHNGDTDSSDDEDNKYYTERKYNECGKVIKHLLQEASTASEDVTSELSWNSKHKPKELAVKGTLEVTGKVDADPFFGIRMINPLVSFTTLQERMIGREAITFSKIKKFVMGQISNKNWVIGGVVVNKSSVKTSQKGNQFLIWDLSDLKNDIKQVSVFLFGSAYKQLWKTAVGTVVGILNPSVLDKKDGSKYEATLSVDNVQKVMVLGKSKDLGTCKSTKKNGEPCTAIVNINQCEHCIYHLKQAYQKCSQRSELQSNFVGKGLTALRNKVLGKDEVFYAGKLYTAIPAKKSSKLQGKDKTRLDALNGLGAKVNTVRKTAPRKSATNVEISHRQKLRDLTLLEKLGGPDIKTDFNAAPSTEVTLHDSRQTAVNVIAKLKAKAQEDTSKVDVGKSPLDRTRAVPVLTGKEDGVIDFSSGTTYVNKAKSKALKYVQTKGPIRKNDPNSVKRQSTNVKRLMEQVEDTENHPKRQKLNENEFLSDRFKSMLTASSKHSDLVEVRDNEEQEQYFHKLEAKEKMEEKMVNTFKMPCKAVRCLKCRYTNFSAAQLCKDEKHPLKVFDAVKRFFKCGSCGNRIQSLEVIPVSLCQKCGSVQWERTGMMKEKVTTLVPQLSIRGGEQKFVNSVVSDANLSLLMADE